MNLSPSAGGASRFSRKTRSPISPNGFFAAEIIREKAIRALHHELPYV